MASGGGNGGRRGGDGGDGGGDGGAAAATVHTAGGGSGGSAGDPFAPVHFAVALVALAPGRSAAAGSAAAAAAAAAEAAADAAADALASRLVVVVGAKGADCTTTCAAEPERGGGGGAGGGGGTPGLSCAPAGFRLVNNCPALRAHFDCRACELAAAGTAGRDMPCWVVPTAPVGHPRGYCMVHPQSGSACDAKYQHTRRLCPCVRQGGGGSAAAGEEGGEAVGDGDTSTRPA